MAGILQTVAGAAPLPGGPGNGPHSTVPVIAGLQAIKATQAMIDSVLAPFPVAGPATYGDDFGEARGFPLPHIHQGVDIAAAQGTPLLACAPGVVTVTPDTSGLDPDGGNSLSIVAPDGTRYYYAHLAAYAPGLASGQHVAPGQVIGGVGMTGDATGPHLHFEIHPGGGAAVDPTPFLDRWLSQALQTAQALGGIPSTAMTAADIGASPSGSTGLAAPAAVGPGTDTMTLQAATPDRSALQTALASVHASARRGPSPAASTPFVAAAGAVLFWLLLRYRQRRLAGLGLAAARAGLPGTGPDPSDPLWSSDLRPLARAVPARRRNAPRRKEAKAKDS